MISLASNALRRTCAALAVACVSALPACSSDNELVLADAALDARAAEAAKELLGSEAHDLSAAATALCAAAPSPAPGGWSSAHDGAAIAKMKASWKDTERAYQGLEGAVELFFPDLGAALGGRYEDALARGRDPDLLDGEGFVGLHAIERVLWADRIPASVIASEATLDGYAPASFPADESAASRFRDGLCARLIADADALEAGIGELALDSSGAYASASRLVARQAEKVLDAGAGHDESRYAGHTLADMSANVAGAEAMHAVFREWLSTKALGPHIDDEIAGGFTRLKKEYAAFGSEALPYVPTDWSAANLTHSALATPFGQLYIVVANEGNGALDGSLAHSMDEAVTRLGISYAQ